VLRGARVLVLVECKRNSRPVEREQVLALESKRVEVGAHKAMIFSTGGFQSGALQYAGSRGIATVTFLDGRFLYETRGRMPASPPPWVILPRFAAMMLREKDKQIMCSGIGGSDDSLREWITTAPPTSKSWNQRLTSPSPHDILCSVLFSYVDVPSSRRMAGNEVRLRTHGTGCSAARHGG